MNKKEKMKNIIFTSLLVLGVMFCFGQTQDTIILKNGKKIPCKVIDERVFTIEYLVKGEYQTTREIINTEKVRKVKYFIDKKLPEQPEQVDYKIPEGAKIIDTLKYLLAENAYLKMKQNQLEVNTKSMFKHINLAGKNFRNAGILSFVSAGTGILTGVFAYEYNRWSTKTGTSQTEKDMISSNQETYRTLYLAAGITTAVCVIVIPIELIIGGSRLNKIK
jgi:hypothetical protein